MESRIQFVPETVVKWHPDLAAAEIDGEIVVMSFSGGQYVGLNDIASAIWRRLEQPQQVAEMCAALASSFDGDLDVIRADVTTLLGRLDELGLIQVVERPPTDAG